MASPKGFHKRDVCQDKVYVGKLTILVDLKVCESTGHTYSQSIGKNAKNVEDLVSKIVLQVKTENILI